ncbi:MAG: hypothetical protein AAGC93_11250 [Cyanobacteria bacterium P01_F01_bin.53]
MSARPSSLSAESRPLTDEITLNETLNCLLENLPLEMTEAYDRQQLFAVLLKAASDRESIEQASKSMNVSPHAVQADYRHRFGIESSYRLKNLSRIRSTTKNPVLRLLFVSLAFIIVNVWIYLLWQYLRIARPGGSLVVRQCFPLKMMLSFLRQASRNLRIENSS